MQNPVQNVNVKLMGFLPALCLTFVIFKLAGKIAWSWWWVFAPIWGPFAIVIGGFAVVALLAALAYGILWAIERK